MWRTGLKPAPTTYPPLNTARSLSELRDPFAFGLCSGHALRLCARLSDGVAAASVDRPPFLLRFARFVIPWGEEFLYLLVQ